MIQYVIDHEKMVKRTRGQAIRILLVQNGEFRVNQIEIPLDVDPVAYTASNVNIQEVWDSGSPSSQGAYIAAQERNFVEYYYSVLMSMHLATLQGATLDQVILAGLQASQAVPAKFAEFQAWANVLGISLDLETSSVSEKRDLINLMFSLANMGVVAGGVR